MDEIPYRMAEAPSTPFEVRLDAPRRALLRIGVPRIDAPIRTRREGFAHLLGIVRPVGRQMQATAVRRARGQECEESRRDEATLPVPLLVPWVGKVHAHFRERLRRDLVL